MIHMRNNLILYFSFSNNNNDEVYLILKLIYIYIYVCVCVCVCVFIIGTCHQQFLDQIDSFIEKSNQCYGFSIQLKILFAYFFCFYCKSTHTHTHTKGMKLISRVFICDLIQLIQEKFYITYKKKSRKNCRLSYFSVSIKKMYVVHLKISHVY